MENIIKRPRKRNHQKMKGKSHRLLLGVLVVCLFIQRTSSASRSYKQVLKDMGMTLPGAYETFENTSKIRCAFICTLAGCDGLAWDELTKKCRIYNELFIYLEPVQTSQGALKTYLPDDTQVIFITIIKDSDMTWYSAKADCEGKGEKMLYISNEDEIVRLFGEHGKFHVGVYKIGDQSAPWTDLFGNTIQESDINWAAGNPKRLNDTLCLGRYDINGYHDVTCYTAYSTSPKTVFCTFTES